MSVTNSANMSLPIPGVGTESGPNYSFDVNASLTLVDQHDHSIGKGVQITPAGININAALSMGGNNLTNIASLVLVSQSAVSTLRALYVAPGSEVPTTDDLWFNDGNGNAIQITSGGTVNASIASLPGENYSAGTFFWKQGAGSTTPANFDIGSITIRPNTAGTTNGVQLNPPSGIASQYGLQLPLLPATTKFLQLDASGNITGGPNVTAGLDHTNLSGTAGILGSQLSTTAGIVGTQIASATITDSNIAATGINGAGVSNGGHIQDQTVDNAAIAIGAVTPSNMTSASYHAANTYAGGTITSGNTATIFTGTAVAAKNRPLFFSFRSNGLQTGTITTAGSYRVDMTYNGVTFTQIAGSSALIPMSAFNTAYFLPNSVISSFIYTISVTAVSGNATLTATSLDVFAV